MQFSLRSLLFFMTIVAVYAAGVHASEYWGGGAIGMSAFGALLVGLGIMSRRRELSQALNRTAGQVMTAQPALLITFGSVFWTLGVVYLVNALSHMRPLK